MSGLAVKESETGFFLTAGPLRMGEFTGAVRAAPAFAFEVARPEATAEAAEREMELVLLHKRCPACGKMNTSGFDFFGADCQKRVVILSGRTWQREAESQGRRARQLSL